MKSLIWILILVVLFFVWLRITVKDNRVTPKNSTDSAVESNQKNADEECLNGYKKQDEYLASESLSKEFTFEKYKTKYVEPKTLSNLDLNSRKTAKMFRSGINDQLDSKEVNFDGKYNIVGVGMTGWDGPIWIIDRTNGKAYEFPYHNYRFSLTFQKGSNLIILSSKEDIKETRSTQRCFYLNIIPEGEDPPFRGYDLIPQYFLWENNQLIYLGPKEYQPLINPFWDQYFND